MDLKTAWQILDDSFAERHAIIQSESDGNPWEVWWDGVKVVSGLTTKQMAKDIAKQMDKDFAKNLIKPVKSFAEDN